MYTRVHELVSAAWHMTAKWVTASFSDTQTVKHNMTMNSLSHVRNVMFVQFLISLTTSKSSNSDLMEQQIPDNIT